MFDTIVKSTNQQMNHAMNQSTAIYQIKTAEALLADECYKAYIDHLKALVKKDDDNEDAAFAEAFFESLYMDLIVRYAQMVQSISTKDGVWSRFVLNNGLLRAMQALEHYLSIYGYHQIEEGDIMPYAIYSAALLANIGQVFGEYQFQLVDEHGSYQANWDPIEGPMTQYQVTWYRMRPIEPIPQATIKAHTIILATTKLLPELGYKWLSEDHEVLAWWIDALNDLSEGMIQFKIDLLLDNEFVTRHRLIDIDVEHLFPKELMEAEKFLAYMKEAYEKELKKQRAHYYKTKRGIVVSQATLQQYVSKHGGSVDGLVKKLHKAGITSSKGVTRYGINAGAKQSGMFTSGVKSLQGIEISKQQFKLKDHALKSMKTYSAAYAAKFIQNDQAQKMAKSGQSLTNFNPKG
jgi:hypothetical protein